MSLTISIVNHGHDMLVNKLLSSLIDNNEYISKIIITNNIPGNINYSTKAKLPIKIVILNNSEPIGFGENHNNAFKYCETKYYCVLNPDIILSNNPFGALLSISCEKDIAIMAPLIQDVKGNIEDSARDFPTPFGLLKKLIGLNVGIYSDYKNELLIYPEWVGGMLMLIKSDVYERLSGFDESYFLYYEDVDLCLRAWRSGNRVALTKNVVVVHDARRTSHRNIKYLKWHITSMVRFFIKHLGRFPKVSI